MSNVRRRLVMVVAMCLCAVSGGCIHGMETPGNLVNVEQYGDGFVARAISADGVVVGLRQQVNPDNGTLDFWAQAIENEMQAAKGYRLVKKENVTSSAGRPGRWMEFTVQQPGGTFRYINVVYVAQKAVLIAEAGGKDAAVESHMADIRKAMLSVH